MCATTDAMLACMHHGDTENVIFYTDLRAFGRGFDEYIKRGERGRAIRCASARPGGITEDPEARSLFVWYDDTESGGVRMMEVDTAVLSTAFVPPQGLRGLAEVLGVEMDESAFFMASDDRLAPVDTGVPGIWTAGARARPMDDTDAVARGGGGADRAAQATKQFAGKATVSTGSGR